ncbi:MAG: MFS transporter [Pseudonocardia sp.]|uniref:MFS transporter n=1 Tax=unclassified Pseudonocardia TaxID=2619320 RepID=UPI00086C4062|nr:MULTISPECIES: MFS transporter [unclassified Pseudonocardia]MBN9112839.1 MFS transporter [Pseudonocardia sp.]ODV00177.1 MAG: MFS transporter [Pseudonocardia sp. SCN 73-27]
MAEQSVAGGSVGPGKLAARSKWLALTAMMFAVAMTFIDQTIVAIAAPNIQSELGLTSSGVTWVVNSYLLALAAGFALGGRLADVLGSRRIVILGIVGFAVTSTLCGLTPSGALAEAWIIVFRALQGLSAALMIPAALAVVVSSFPVGERGKALAIFFGVSGGLTAIGPIAGGYLTQWTWRAIFWINVPVAVVALVLTIAAGIAPSMRRERIDWRGALVIAVGMALSVLGFEQARNWGWDSPLTWLCIVGGLVALGLFVWLEQRTEVPLIKIGIFRGRAFLSDNLVLFFSMIAFVPVFFFASIYSQVALGYGASSAGLYLLVFFAGFAPAAQIGGRILDKQGAKPSVVAGCVVATVGFLCWAWKITDLSLGSQWWCIVLAGAGIGLLLGPASTDATNRAIDASYGEVTGITQTVRNYGSALGLAVLGTVLGNVFASRMETSLAAFGLPPSAAASLASSGGGDPSALANVPEQLRSRIEAAVATDFAVATRAVLVGMAIALVISLGAALLHPGGRVTDDSTTL